MKRLLLALPLAFLVPSTSMAETFKKPALDTPQAAIIEGMKLIKDGKFDDWISKWCSKEKKCLNDQANSALKRYNLPAKQRRAAACIKDGDTIEVTRTDKISETELKIFVQCEPTAMPIPFWMIKEGSAWHFSNI
ncbi:MAG: hypothetical protein U1F43_01585 [Myxococcota bacterium]